MSRTRLCQSSWNCPRGGRGGTVDLGGIAAWKHQPGPIHAPADARLYCLQRRQSRHREAAVPLERATQTIQEAQNARHRDAVVPLMSAARDFQNAQTSAIEYRAAWAS